MNALQREIAEMKKWKAQQEAFNQARLDKFDQKVREKATANLLATGQNGNSASPSGENADQNSTDE